MKRARNGSVYIYAQEYICTTVETVVTTMNITEVRLSKRKLKLIGNSEILSQDHSSTLNM